MKNRILLITRDSIPYIKELRKLPLVKSVSTCIVMQQLDYWFNTHPDGFYKFTEPVPDHPAYKDMDSWTEELGISADEFRTAFDQIGYRHKSKKAFDSAEDKFNGKYYCCYYDRISKLTHYLRNDLIVDKELDILIYGTETDSVQLQKPTVSSSVTQDCPVTEDDNAELHYTETTTKTTTETTSRDNPFPVNGEVIAGLVEHAKWLSKAGQAREVFEDWKEVMESPRSKMDSKREKLIIAKLDLGYSVEDLKLATRGCVLTPWNMGTDPNNKAKTIYNDPELIFRDAAHVDRFRAVALKKGKSANDKLRKSDYDGTKSSANRTGFVAGKRI